MEKNLWSDLFSGTTIIPLSNMTFSEQLNSLTRLILVIFVILLLFEFKHALTFLVLSLLFIIILYRIEKSKIEMKKAEKFTMTFNSVKNSPGIRNVEIDTGQKLLYVNDSTPIPANAPKSWMSKNQMLAFGANPITKIAPIIVPKSHDMSYWRANESVVNSHVNEISTIDNYASGYAVSDCCDNPVQIRRPKMNSGKEGYIQAPTPMEPIPRIPTLQSINAERMKNMKPVFENYIQAPTPMEPIPRIPALQSVSKEQARNMQPIYENYEELNYNSKPNESGWVNTTCGYNPQQTEYNLPANMAIGSCNQSEELKNYNRNLFTQTIVPGVYDTNDVIEPISSDIGISYQQQFEPKTRMVDEQGNVWYRQYDPRLVQTRTEYLDPNELPPTETSTYDPRFSGYGTSYRSYIDEVTGQPRYAYDDINAQRMPNYIVRSKVDTIKGGDTYGSLNPGMEMGQSLSNVKDSIMNEWNNNSLSYRSDLMESLMRKRNNEMWQVRMYPKRTM